MNLCEELKKISKTHTIDGNLKLKITVDKPTYFTGTNEVIGNFVCYTQAIDNTPEIAQIDLKIPQYPSGYVVLLETEIKSIEVLED